MERADPGAGELVLAAATPLLPIALGASYVLDWPHSGLTAALRDSGLPDTRARIEVIAVGAAVIWAATLGYGLIGLITSAVDGWVRRSGWPDRHRHVVSVVLCVGLLFAWFVAVTLTDVGVVVYQTMIPLIAVLAIAVVTWFLLRRRRVRP